MNRQDKRSMMITGVMMAGIIGLVVALAQVVGWAKALLDASDAGVLGTIVYFLMHRRHGGPAKPD